MTTISAQIDQTPAATQAVHLTCAHCGLDVPLSHRDGRAAHAFCCSGCKTVFELLNRHGLDQYYLLRELVEAPKLRATTTSNTYESFDDASFLDAHTGAHPDGSREIVFHLAQVHCAACVWLVEKLPTLLPGVRSATLNLRKRIATVVWQPKTVRLSQIAMTLDRLGYPPQPYRSTRAEQAQHLANRRLLIHIAVAGAIAGNVMVIAFALYGEHFHGMNPALRTFLRVLSLTLTLTAAAWPGRTFFRGAIVAIRARVPHMDLPIAIGLGAGIVTGAVNVARDGGHVYFESITMLIFLLLIGRWIQQRQQRASHRATELLYTITPMSARRILDSGFVEVVAVESIRPGDTVEVRAGDSIPVDGTVAGGTASIDMSILTGESRPVTVQCGDDVFAGGVNMDRPLRITASACGEMTRIGQLMKLVEAGAEQRIPVVRMAHRVAGVFVVAVIIAAACAAGVWLFIDPSRSVGVAMSLLIVTCPCALGLATPLAMVASVGQAAHRGILVRNAEVLERLARPGIVFLDKTGTLTRGMMSVAVWQGPDELRATVAAIAQHSAHPIARALAADCVFEHQLAGTIVDVVEQTGGGMSATVNGVEVCFGTQQYIASCGATLSRESSDLAKDMAAEGLSPLFVAEHGHVRAVAGIGDPIRPGADEAIASMIRRDWDVRVLSGDHPDVVMNVAARLGVALKACRGRATPEEKLAIVTHATGAGGGPVVMVGDGVNDTAALAAADIGIAVRGGAEASLAVADVYIDGADPSAIVSLVDGARRTLSTIRHLMVISIGYNAVGATLAVTGVINPLIAAILMPLSSLTVVAISYRSRYFRRS